MHWAYSKKKKKNVTHQDSLFFDDCEAGCSITDSSIGVSIGVFP